MMTTAILKAKLLEISGSGDSKTQNDAAEELAQAIIDTIKTAQINYTTGLISGSPGNPVTGTLLSATLS